jgi:ferredoxin
VTSATFRVHVDPDKCQGHNRCYSVSPQLFELDDLACRPKSAPAS